MMNLFILMLLSAALLPAFASAAQAQNLDEVFRKASPTVVACYYVALHRGNGSSTQCAETQRHRLTSWIW